MLFAMLRLLSAIHSRFATPIARATLLRLRFTISLTLFAADYFVIFYYA